MQPGPGGGPNGVLGPTGTLQLTGPGRLLLARCRASLPAADPASAPRLIQGAPPVPTGGGFVSAAALLLPGGSRGGGGGGGGGAWAAGSDRARSILAAAVPSARRPAEIALSAGGEAWATPMAAGGRIGAAGAGEHGGRWVEAREQLVLLPEADMLLPARAEKAAGAGGWGGGRRGSRKGGKKKKGGRRAGGVGKRQSGSGEGMWKVKKRPRG